jgi:hypothetical protein
MFVLLGVVNLECVASVLRVVQPVLGNLVGNPTHKEATSCLLACAVG